MKELEAEVAFTSSVGEDAELITNFLDENQILTTYLQTQPVLPTGRAIVRMDEKKCHL